MISCDSLADSTRFAKEHDADYPILSDATKEIATQYGVAGPGGFPKRWTFYISPDGTIARIDKEVKPASAGADMAATLGELNIARRK